jgi:hypothetical protein
MAQNINAENCYFRRDLIDRLAELAEFQRLLVLRLMNLPNIYIFNSMFSFVTHITGYFYASKDGITKKRIAYELSKYDQTYYCRIMFDMTELAIFQVGQFEFKDAAEFEDKLPGLLDDLTEIIEDMN